MGEFLQVPPRDVQTLADDVSRVSPLPLRLTRLPVEVTEFLVIGVTKLERWVPGAEKQESLISVELSSSVASSSVASYMSSNPCICCICCCHSVSEQDEVVPAESGDINRASRACVGTESPLVLSVNLGLVWAGLNGGGLPAPFSENCDSRLSSIMVLSSVPRACRRGGYRAARNMSAMVSRSLFPAARYWICFETAVRQ